MRERLVSNRTFLDWFAKIAPAATLWMGLNRPSAKFAATECNNKCRVMTLVQSRKSYISAGGATELRPLVDSCYQLGSFESLWAIEGLGKDFADAAGRSIRGAFSSSVFGKHPEGDPLMMLHAGMGIAFAKRGIESLPSRPTLKHLELFVSEFLALCEENSDPAYCGAAIESLGLASRFLENMSFCNSIDRCLVGTNAHARGFFWRGVGRGCYFHPSSFLPRFIGDRSVLRVVQELPTQEAQGAVISGMVWAMTLVNMRNPGLLGMLFDRDDLEFFGEGPVENGIVSSVIMRRLTTPNDPFIHECIRQWNDRRRDGSLTPSEARLCRVFVKAERDYCPLIVRSGRPDQLFHHSEMEKLLKNEASGP